MCLAKTWFNSDNIAYIRMLLWLHLQCFPISTSKAPDSAVYVSRFETYNYQTASKTFTMYTIIALATLALAGMSQAAGSHLESALKNENVAAGVGKNGVRSIKLDGDRVQLKPRDGGK